MRDRRWEIQGDSQTGHSTGRDRNREGTDVTPNTPVHRYCSDTPVASVTKPSFEFLPLYLLCMSVCELVRTTACLCACLYACVYVHLPYKTQIESTKPRCKKRLSALKAMASKCIEQSHLFLLCDTQRHWLWSVSHKPVTVQPAEARQGTRQSHESFWEQQKTHPSRPCATYWTCHSWKQDSSKSKGI